MSIYLKKLAAPIPNIMNNTIRHRYTIVSIPIILYRFFKFRKELFNVSWSFVYRAIFILDANRYKNNDITKYKTAMIR